MEQLKQWWDGLAARERRTLSIGGMALAVILFYFMIYQPIHDRTADLEREARNQQELSGFLAQATEELRSRGISPMPTGESRNGTGRGSDQALFALADQTARQAGLGRVLRRVEPSGQGGARVSFEQIAFDDLVRWLAALREQHGVSASVVTARRSELEGRVDVQLVLEAGS
ncbi:MAG: type II secretion system protein M [Ectothiorhodospiraceae bacterium]|nr:type II secretion system protein M [Ectothiorhodospiraceae bacterium]